MERSIPMVAVTVWATTVFSIMKLQDDLHFLYIKLLWKILPTVKLEIMVLFRDTTHLCQGRLMLTAAIKPVEL